MTISSDTRLSRLTRFAFLFISLMVFLAGYSALTMPLGSQNYAQFLTGIVCQRPDLGLCRRSAPPLVSSSIESEMSVPFRTGDPSSSLTSNLVEVGSLNAANTLRSTEPHTRMMQVLAPLLGQDVIASQIRMLLAISFVVVSIALMTASALTHDERRWFLLSIGFSLLLGDHLANSSSIAPIGLSTMSFICSISAASSLLFSSRESLQDRKRQLRLIAVLMCGSLVMSSTRIDQFLLLTGLTVGLIAQGLITRHDLGATRVDYLKRALVLVIAMAPSILLVGVDRRVAGFSPAYLASHFEPTSTPETSSLIWETIVSPIYFALDLFPGFSENSDNYFVLRVLYGIVGMILIFQTFYFLARLRTRSLLLSVFLVGVGYTVLYGTIIGPRAELRYVWAAIIGSVFVVSSSLPWLSPQAQPIKTSLGCGLALGAFANLYSILKIFDFDKRFWYSKINSVSSIAIYGLVLLAGLSSFVGASKYFSNAHAKIPQIREEGV